MLVLLSVVAFLNINPHKWCCKCKPGKSLLLRLSDSGQKKMVISDPIHLPSLIHLSRGEMVFFSPFFSIFSFYPSMNSQYLICFKYRWRSIGDLICWIKCLNKALHAYQWNESSAWFAIEFAFKINCERVVKRQLARSFEGSNSQHIYC